ncbi:unnamed protein product [Pelagomonas calceolata]|uniref:HEAT repeat domain-containing protein n=1 Tax=Pelagomonas calceolata TaxID=35677 RepID=A0A8J2SEM1_9STRA|nr:unnamed protein product [Pelagomonas calceolata]|mmetsp:Transcript_14129/g.40403  ORF Transcript_14129/g.40403 Transcript_14129/m.40403 type:complete len:195 (-) Transcript_14129:41-625(-)
MADEGIGADSTVDADGITQLVALVGNGAAKVKEVAAEGLTDLASESAAYSAAIIDAGAIEPLMRLVTNGTSMGRKKAMVALSTLAEAEPAEGQREAAWALVRLAEALVRGGPTDYDMDARKKVAVAEAGAVDPLIRLVCDASEDLKFGAAEALRELDRATRRRIRILQDENKSLKRQLDRIEGEQVAQALARSL